MLHFDNFVNNCYFAKAFSQRILDDSMNGQYTNAGAYIDGIVGQCDWANFNLRDVAQSIASIEEKTAVEPICYLFEALDMIIQSKSAYESALELNQVRKKCEAYSHDGFIKAVDSIGKAIAAIFSHFNEVSIDALNQIMENLQGLRNVRLVQNAVKPYLEQTVSKTSSDEELVEINVSKRHALVQAAKDWHYPKHTYLPLPQICVRGNLDFKELD